MVGGRRGFKNCTHLRCLRSHEHNAAPSPAQHSPAPTQPRTAQRAAPTLTFAIWGARSATSFSSLSRSVANPAVPPVSTMPPYSSRRMSTSHLQRGEQAGKHRADRRGQEASSGTQEECEAGREERDTPMQALRLPVVPGPRH